MIHAFLKTRSSARQWAAPRVNRPFKRRASLPVGGEEAVWFKHEVDMSRVRPLTDREWSQRLAGESRFAAWMGIYGIVIGVLLGWFVATVHTLAYRDPASSMPKMMPVSQPKPKALPDPAPAPQALEEVTPLSKPEPRFENFAAAGSKNDTV